MKKIFPILIFTFIHIFSACGSDDEYKNESLRLTKLSTSKNQPHIEETYEETDLTSTPTSKKDYLINDFNLFPMLTPEEESELNAPPELEKINDDIMNEIYLNTYGLFCLLPTLDQHEDAIKKLCGGKGYYPFLWLRAFIRYSPSLLSWIAGGLAAYAVPSAILMGIDPGHNYISGLAREITAWSVMVLHWPSYSALFDRLFNTIIGTGKSLITKIKNKDMKWRDLKNPLLKGVSTPTAFIYSSVLALNYAELLLYEGHVLELVLTGPFFFLAETWGHINYANAKIDKQFNNDCPEVRNDRKARSDFVKSCIESIYKLSPEEVKDYAKILLSANSLHNKEIPYSLLSKLSKLQENTCSIAIEKKISDPEDNIKEVKIDIDKALSNVHEFQSTSLTSLINIESFLKKRNNLKQDIRLLKVKMKGSNSKTEKHTLKKHEVNLETNEASIRHGLNFLQNYATNIEKDFGALRGKISSLRENTIHHLDGNTTSTQSRIHDKPNSGWTLIGNIISYPVEVLSFFGTGFITTEIIGYIVDPFFKENLFWRWGLQIVGSTLACAYYTWTYHSTADIIEELVKPSTFFNKSLLIYSMLKVSLRAAALSFIGYRGMKRFVPGWTPVNMTIMFLTFLKNATFSSKMEYKNMEHLLGLNGEWISTDMTLRQGLITWGEKIKEYIETSDTARYIKTIPGKIKLPSDTPDFIGNLKESQRDYEYTSFTGHVKNFFGCFWCFCEKMYSNGSVS